MEPVRSADWGFIAYVRLLVRLLVETDSPAAYADARRPG
jgi:hypothetical protein